jgi:hypothetical protein
MTKGMLRRSAGDPKTRGITLAQTISLLSLSRGEQPLLLAPNLRRSLLRRQWIVPPRPFAISPDGRAALARSPYLAQARRILEKPPSPPLRRGRLAQ